MRTLLLTSFLFFSFSDTWCQNTFKAGWTTYNTGVLVREYAFSVVLGDSVKLYFTDSSQVFSSQDSLVVMDIDFPSRESSSTHKVVSYLNAKKRIIRKEEYNNENLLAVNEWKYDDKNRKTLHMEDNKQNGNVYRKIYDYTVEKKTGESISIESAYFNGKIEFYTKSYFDKNNVKIKEVRLNDNNKDVVHIESFAYGENGKVKERTVYFPEWKVTKKFEEKGGNEVPKCYRTLPVGISDKVNLSNKIAYIKKVILKNQLLISDHDCHDFEYHFSNFSNCEIVVTNTNVNNGKRLVFRFKEKY